MPVDGDSINASIKGQALGKSTVRSHDVVGTFEF